MCGAEVELVTGQRGQVAAASLVAGRTTLDFEVLPIVPGVWSVVGLSVANTHIIDAPDGVIVVDSGRSNEDGEVLRRCVAETIGKPIAAVVFTHSHYVAGTQALIGDDQVEIIANAKLDRRYRERLHRHHARFALPWYGSVRSWLAGFRARRRSDRDGNGPTNTPATSHQRARYPTRRDHHRWGTRIGDDRAYV